MPPPALSPRQVAILELVKALRDLVSDGPSQALLDDLLKRQGVA